MNGDGEPGRLFGGPDVGLGLANYSDKKDAAWEVISWLTSEEAQSIFARELQFPAITSVDLDTSDVITDNQREALLSQADDMANAVGKREFLYSELKTALGDALQNVATGAQTPEEALAEVERVSQSIDRS